MACNSNVILDIYTWYYSVQIYRKNVIPLKEEMSTVKVKKYV